MTRFPIPGYLRRFIFRTALVRTYRLAAYTLFAWLILIVAAVLFLNDQLSDLTVRYTLGGLVLISGLAGVTANLVRLFSLLHQDLKHLSPLRLEWLLARFTSVGEDDRFRFLNRFFLSPADCPDPHFPFIRPAKPDIFRFLLPGAALIFLAMLPWLAPAGWNDLWFPWKPSTHLSRLKMDVIPGSTALERGDSLQIRVRYTGSPGPLNLQIRFEDGQVLTEKSPNNRDLVFIRPNLQQSVVYSVGNAWFQSESYTIRLLDRPFVSGWKLTVHPPRYTQGRSFVHPQSDGNRLQIPEGSLVTLQARFTGDIDSGMVKGWPGNPVFRSGDISTNATLFHPAQFRFLLTDIHHLSNRDTARIEIGLIPDEPPVIQAAPLHALTTRDFRIPLVVRLADDYGLNRLIAEYRIRSVLDLMEPDWIRQDLQVFSSAGQQFYEGLPVWQVPGQSVFPGDVIEFRLGVTDHYPRIPGGHLVWTDVFTIKTPGTEEAFAQADSLSNQLTETMEELRAEAKELEKKAKQVADDIKRRSGSLNFTEQNRLNDLASEQKKLDEKMENLKQQADDQFTQLNQSQVLPPETLQKYLELQKLLEETDNTRLRDMLEQLSKQLNTLDRRDVINALQSVEMTAEAIDKQLDKSIQTVKQLQLEQKFEEFTQKSLETAMEQQSIRNEQSKPEANEDKLALRQDLQTSRIEDLERTLDELTKQARELKESSTQTSKMDQARQQMKQQDMTNLSRQTAESIKKGDEEQAAEQSKKLSEQLQSLNQQATDIQKSFKKNQNMVVLEKLRRLLTQATQWSELAGQKPPASDVKKWGASFSDQLLQSLKPFQDSSRAISAMEPQLGLLLDRDLESAANQLANARDQYVNNQVSAGEQNRAGARVTMNGMVYRLLTMMNTQSGNQGGASPDSREKGFFEEMRELANRQQQLNQQVLNESGQSSSSGPGKERLAQMAAQQQLIRQQLSELMKQSGGQQQGLSGSMSAVEKEMEAVAEDLMKGIDSKLVERQQKILSRMLDSQKSTIEREFEERRESQSAKQTNRMRDFTLKTGSVSPDQRGKILRNLDRYQESYRKLLIDYYTLPDLKRPDAAVPNR
ncbi:MAG: hypothetical protein HUU10_08445 [Bacteroidetes bacterium]|nr:hypothetical protein [Bacteroidota bacterium]